MEYDRFLHIMTSTVMAPRFKFGREQMLSSLFIENRFISQLLYYNLPFIIVQMCRISIK